MNANNVNLPSNGEQAKKAPFTEEVKKTTVMDVVYFVLPILSICMLFALWVYVAKMHPSLFPGPVATWERFVKLLQKPIMRVSFGGHILASLKRVVIALLFAWTIGISFGVLIGWNKKNGFFLRLYFLYNPSCSPDSMDSPYHNLLRHRRSSQDFDCFYRRCYAGCYQHS